MQENTQTNYSGIVLSIGIASFTIIGALLGPEILRGPDINIVVFDWKENNFTSSKIQALIQNVGNGPAEQIGIFFDTGNFYESTFFESPDGFYGKIEQDKNKTRIELTKLSPGSYARIDFEGALTEDKKEIWLMYNDKTKIIDLPYSPNSIGVTSFIPESAGDQYYIPLAIVLSVLLASRYWHVKRADKMRRNYLSILNYKPSKFFSKSFKIVIFVVIAAFIASAISTSYQQPNPFTSLSTLEPFQLEDDNRINDFMNQGYSASPTGIEFIVLAGAIFSAFIASVYDPPLPRYQWFLPISDRTDIRVKNILSSTVKFQKASLRCMRKHIDSDTDIIILVDNDKILGLISKKEIEIVNMKQKTPFQNIIMLNNINSPKWDDDSNSRNNYDEIFASMTITQAKTKLTDNSRRFGIILDDKTHKIIGVLDYYLIAKK